MKRISLGLATLSLTASLSAYAAFPTDAAPFQVMIPNLSPGWELAVSGLYQQPLNTDQDFGVVASNSGAIVTSQNTFTYNLQTMEQIYYWGIGVMAGYIFPCSGNDIRASWVHLFQKNADNDTNATFTGAVQNPLVNPIWNSGALNTFSTATSSEDFRYDAVDLNAGQFVDIGTRLRTRLYVGARYAHIGRDWDTNFYDIVPATASFLSSHIQSTYDGVGPEFGFDSSYHLGWCLGLIGHFTGAVLVGEVRADTNYSYPKFLGGLPTSTINTTSITSSDETRIVPAVDAKLGLDWSHTFCGCGTDRSISLEAGWEVAHYVDAIDRIDIQTGSFVSNNSLAPASLTRETSNVGFQGPYVTLSVKL